MARIRSIKPEFWTDGKICRLSEGCALFFIALWNFCDDEGKCQNDSYELELKMRRFRSQEISKWISRLTDEGLVRTSTDLRWILVTNWSHQKIDRPRVPKVRNSEIEWNPQVVPDISSNARRMLVDDSSNVRRKDRIGLDRIGLDRIDTEKPKPPRIRTPKTVPQEGDLSLAQDWLKYSQEVMPWQKSFTQERFARDIAKVKQKTDLNDAGISAVLQFVRDDDFWRDKAISPIGLLKVGKNGLRKIDTILSQMQPKEDKTARALREFALGTDPIPECPF